MSFDFKGWSHIMFCLFSLLSFLFLINKIVIVNPIIQHKGQKVVDIKLLEVSESVEYNIQPCLILKKTQGNGLAFSSILFFSFKSDMVCTFYRFISIFLLYPVKRKGSRDIKFILVACYVRNELLIYFLRKHQLTDPDIKIGILNLWQVAKWGIPR